MLNHQLERAVSFLISHQDADGYWRDYQLEPGRSDAWTTACVGFALVQVKGRCPEVDKAAKVLLSTRRPSGWGYNSLTSCDADTTSWVIRFLSAVDAMEGLDAADILSTYITHSGRVHTFPAMGHFGSWGREHDEVAPLVGMALLATGNFAVAESVRQGVLNRSNWMPFWWHCYSYLCAQSLEFLALGGGIPDEIKMREAAILASLSPIPSSIFDLAQRLSATSSIDGDVPCDALFEAQEKDGGWPPSFELLVPSQQDEFSGDPVADDRRLMSTAMSILALLKREKEKII